MADGLLAVVSNNELDQREQASALEAIAVEDAQKEAAQEAQTAVENLASYIKKQYDAFQNHRQTSGLDDRMIAALEAYNGRYSSEKLAEIKTFGGSEVYARVTTTKCRGATSLLRDVYLSSDTFWGLDPTPVPVLPDDITASVDQLLEAEVAAAAEGGETIQPAAKEARRTELMEAAEKAARKKAHKEANEAELHVQDVLTEGGYYDAFVEFLTDLPIFPYSCIKGPVLKNSTHIKWVDGKMETVTEPRMYWKRVSPFDIFFTPGASYIEEADMIERVKLTRADLNMMIGVPGYSDDAIRAVLDDYEFGLTDWLGTTDSLRALEESKEQAPRNTANLIDTLEFHGSVKGEWLLDWGFEEAQVNDPTHEYHVVAWLIGQHVIKVHLNPNPKQRHPYYVSCFERVPGSIAGQCLPEIMGDIQDVANASYRSLVNNMSISSGPQVSINETRLSPSTNGDELYPWKRWRFVSDPYGADNSAPIEFFQPQSNAQELLAVYRSMTEMADEVSAIPRYLTGGGRTGGAASTASGLSMLMSNSAKILQNVAANVDNDIVRPSLEYLYTTLMLTDDKGKLRGDERIVVKGVNMAMAKEQDRMRKLEFLQMTNNPLDQQIVGVKGRATMLRSVSEDLSFPANQVVPTEEDLIEIEKAQQEAMALQAQGDQAPTGGTERHGEETDNMHRVRK